MDNSNIFIVVETWASQQAIDFHNTTPYFVEFANFAKDHTDRLEINIAKQVI
ncbi:putative quinol monooxygenase [Gilliamella sp. Occ4-3]|uniref:putative quinol monooxygenase n=1 Tax=Gilliamella sp. Occ4-3 TaxID=3120254 RepID=UPI00210016F4|nr:antibiotic biosynthesis monooxygenase [Gilliamella apicola]